MPVQPARRASCPTKDIRIRALLAPQSISLPNARLFMPPNHIRLVIATAGQTALFKTPGGQMTPGPVSACEALTVPADGLRKTICAAVQSGSDGSRGPDDPGCAMSTCAEASVF